MTAGIIDIIIRAFTAVSVWAYTLIYATGFFGLLLAVYAMYRITSVLLAPVLGSAGSDKAKPRKDDD